MPDNPLLSEIQQRIRDSTGNDLDLSQCDLGTLSLTDFPEVLRVPRDRGITSLNLGWNDLYQLDASGLRRVFGALRDSGITSLNLEWNDLHQLKVSGLRRAFGALRDSGIISLNLGSNNLEQLGAADLEQVFRALRGSGITELSLGNNNLHLLGANGLVQALEGLRGSRIKVLNLQNNGLWRLNAKERIRVFEVVRDNGITLNVGDDAVKDLSNTDDIIDVLQVTPSSVELSASVRLFKIEGEEATPFPYDRLVTALFPEKWPLLLKHIDPDRFEALKSFLRTSLDNELKKMEREEEIDSTTDERITLYLDTLLYSTQKTEEQEWIIDMQAREALAGVLQNLEWGFENIYSLIQRHSHYAAIFKDTDRLGALIQTIAIQMVEPTRVFFKLACYLVLRVMELDNRLFFSRLKDYIKEKSPDVDVNIDVFNLKGNDIPLLIQTLSKEQQDKLKSGIAFSLREFHLPDIVANKAMDLLKSYFTPGPESPNASASSPQPG